jgi:hypothetical protein
MLKCLCDGCVLCKHDALPALRPRLNSVSLSICCTYRIIRSLPQLEANANSRYSTILHQNHDRCHMVMPSVLHGYLCSDTVFSIATSPEFVWACAYVDRVAGRILFSTQQAPCRDIYGNGIGLPSSFTVVYTAARGFCFPLLHSHRNVGSLHV